MCNKKIKLIFYEGRYNKAFCLQNRAREDHQCTFDILGKGAEELSKENPLVVAVKGTSSGDQDLIEYDEDERFDELSDPSPALEPSNPETSDLDKLNEASITHTPNGAGHFVQPPSFGARNNALRIVIQELLRGDPDALR
ncbi:hypothetical protein QYM36_002743, partial [Artemia franciscana]